MLDASALQLIILPVGILAILFAIYLARDVLSRDTGTKEMEDVAGTILEGAVAFIRRQYFTIGVLAIVGAVAIGIIISVFETEAVADTPVYGANLGIRTGYRLPRRRRLLDGVWHHRHVRGRAGQRPDGIGRPPQPRRGCPGRHARRRRLGLPRGLPVAPRRLPHVRRVRRSQPRYRRPGAVPHRRLRLRGELRRPVRPARWRDLHEGRRRRLGPRRQGRGRHPRGRPPQCGRHR